MKNLNIEINTTFKVNRLLRKYGIEAKLKDIETLSKIINNSIKFNQGLYNIGTIDDVSLATTIEDLIEIYMLRSRVYTEINYTKEFPEVIKGLNFDEYDEHSAILYSKRGDKITGTCRLIFDLPNKKLPIDKNFSLDYLRNKDRILGEASRVIIQNRKGLKQEFKLLTIDSYKILNSYQMDVVSVMTQEHIKLYKNFGGLTIEKKFQNYGTLQKEFFLTLWQTSKISPYFKRIFLKNVA